MLFKVLLGCLQQPSPPASSQAPALLFQSPLYSPLLTPFTPPSSVRGTSPTITSDGSWRSLTSITWFSAVCALPYLTLSPALWGRFYSPNLINKENKTERKSESAKITRPAGGCASSVSKQDYISHTFALIINIQFPPRLRSLGLCALFSLHTCSVHSSFESFHDLAYIQFSILTDPNTTPMWMVTGSKCMRYYPELIVFHACLIIFFPSKDCMGANMVKNAISTLQNRSYLCGQRGSGNGV